MASLRMGPRQTMRGFRSSQAKDRTHGDGDCPSRRSRWMRGLFRYRSAVAAIWVVSCLVSVEVGVACLVELAMRAGHGRRLVVAEHEVQVLAEHLAEVGGHDERRDRPEGEALLRV